MVLATPWGNRYRRLKATVVDGSPFVITVACFAISNSDGAVNGTVSNSTLVTKTVLKRSAANIDTIAQRNTRVS